MSALIFTITGFVTCSAIIIFSGARLSKYGDIITNLTGIGKAWFGLILMSTVTSLPELFTGISSILIFHVPNIAVGDIMGSCAFNLLILALLDYFIPKKPLSSVVTKSHVVAGFFSIFLITLTIISITFGTWFPRFGWFSSASVLIIIVYLIAIRIIFKNEQHLSAAKATLAATAQNEKQENISLRLSVKRYVFFALLVIIGALSLPFFASRLATETGMSKSFIGTLLVAASTSLPELVVSISAVKLGSTDMAVGNLLGSNIFNMLILAFDDLIYTKGPLLLDTNPDHALSGLVTLLMTSVVGIGILYGSPTKRFVLAIDAIILIVLYTILMLAIYKMT
jgi:cation:H+ antiporter